ncbi:aromatic-ring-hydroxylating dioxygenase subunit beta [Nocardioides sp. B-3]|uniref:aromatic-ring-hydroxylating dioxygenase subunit beta n=1 Tax=Nocardioides sp. B-3 TaxID=2895565 RepID=UPI0021526166|nr:aromatic-ring-hydroxylating dioxygenase subunit beta [Nocardioides sp. B-3]UUZ59520.1 aromatic-ring-hydroxylating dioxygenase subunit beta [Nocardioides sp. B-3]
MNSNAQTEGGGFGAHADWPLPDPADHLRLQQFYNFEAHLLDERRFHDWLNLFSEDLHYWMPIRRVLPPRQRSMEFTGPDELAQFDETFMELTQRVDKIETGKAWAEEPPSRTRHLITNLLARKEPDGWSVRTAFIAYQSRSEHDSHAFVGERRDRLECADAAPYGLKICRREIRPGPRDRDRPQPKHLLLISLAPFYTDGVHHDPNDRRTDL